MASGPTGLTTALINSQLSILRPQSYSASVADGSKSGGINMSGLPLNAANLPSLSNAVIKPEHNTTYEIGVKSRLLGDRLLLNIDAYDTTVRDFQTNVVDTGPGALRGYLANIEKVDVKGVEFDGAVVVDRHLSGHVNMAWTDGKYVSYKNGPCPLELIASATTVCDLSGKPLSALPRWDWSVGGEYKHEAMAFGAEAEAYLHVEFTARSKTYGDPSDSQYTVIDGYGVVNASLGLRKIGPWELSVWARNLFDKNYIQNVTVQAGNSGLVVGTPSDPRTVGVTLRARY